MDRRFRFWNKVNEMNQSLRGDIWSYSDWNRSIDAEMGRERVWGCKSVSLRCPRGYALGRIERLKIQ